MPDHFTLQGVKDEIGPNFVFRSLRDAIGPCIGHVDFIFKAFLEVAFGVKLENSKTRKKIEIF